MDRRVTNHPNRNWRQRMQAAADQWQQTSARVLWELPLRSNPSTGWAPQNGLRERCRESYLAGYTDGRKRDT